MSQRTKHEGTEPKWHAATGAYRSAVQLGGKRVWRYGKTPAETSRKIREAVRRYEDGDAVTDSRARVKAWAEKWEAVKLPASGIKQSSRDAYVSAVRCWVLPELGDRLIKDVRESDCEAVMLALVAAGRSGAHRRLIHTAMASLFGTAVRERLITASPMAHVARPSAGKSKAVAVSPEQIHALAANLHSSQMLVHVVPFMALTGTRRGEALGVRWEDVDEEAGVIHLRFQVNRDSSGLDLRSLKTDGSERDIDLTPPLRELLRARRKVQMRDRLRSPVGSWADTGLVFTTRRGTMVEPNNVNRAFRQYAERAGLPTKGKGKVTPHSLRHSVATLLLAAGVDEKVVAELLGHSSPRITREVYQHVMPHQRQEALGKVGEALGW